MQIHSFSSHYAFGSSYYKNNYFKRPEPTEKVPADIQNKMESLPEMEPAKRSNILNEVAIFLNNNKIYDGRGLVDIAIKNIPDEKASDKAKRAYAYELRRLAEYANCDDDKLTKVIGCQKKLLQQSGGLADRDFFLRTTCNVNGENISMRDAAESGEIKATWKTKPKRYKE